MAQSTSERHQVRGKNELIRKFTALTIGMLVIGNIIGFLINWILWVLITGITLAIGLFAYEADKKKKTTQSETA